VRITRYRAAGSRRGAALCGENDGLDPKLTEITRSSSPAMA